MSDLPQVVTSCGILLLVKSGFENAWEEISNRASDSFNELRKFQNDDFPDDPRYWDHPIRARIEEFCYRLLNPVRDD